jgi:hypothetical protein
VPSWQTARVTSGPTWLLTVRDVSGSVRIADTPRVIATMILDADTGLARGVNVAATTAESRTQAMTMALTKPAGPLPPHPPATVICTSGDADQVQVELADLLPDQPQPEVLDGVPIDEVEDIVDSLVGHMNGRAQPERPPEPDDWRLLLNLASGYASAQPWRRWADTDPMDLTVKIGKTARRYVAVILGQEGIQRGLACYPGAVLPAGLHEWEPDRPVPLPAGTLFLWLDPPDEVPAEFAAKARRYGWPAGSALLPVALASAGDGPADLDQTAARHLSLAVSAVLDHHRRPLADDAGTTGTQRLGDGGQGSYTIRRMR